MKEYYLILGCPKGYSFKQSVEELKREGVEPDYMYNLGLAHQYLLWALETPEEFIDRKPKFKGEKIFAIKIEKGRRIPGARLIRATDKDGLSLLLSQMCSEESRIDVSDSEFYDLSKY